LCDGMTEYLYASSLKRELSRENQRGLQIEIDNHAGGNPLTMAMTAVNKKKIAIKEKTPFSAIWLFFDHDNSPKLADAFSIISKNDFNIAYSAICIEHWFVLHFEDCNKAFQTAKQALRHLQKNWPDYNKTKIKHYDHLKNRLPLAIKRAKAIRRNADKALAIERQNPYFTVDKLIAFFDDQKSL
jgi:hypothetical protein